MNNKIKNGVRRRGFIVFLTQIWRQIFNTQLFLEVNDCFDITLPKRFHNFISVCDPF